LLVIAALALVLAAGALVLQFALPSKGGVSQSDYDALKAQVASIKTTGAGLKVAYVNVDNAFQVFLNAVTDLRERLTTKQNEITALAQSYQAGTVTADNYSKQSTVLGVELLDAKISLYVNVLDRMIASDDFSDLRKDLQTVRTKAESILTASKNLVAMVKGGATSTSDLQARYTQTQAAYTDLEGVINQACALKIQMAAQRVAIQKGYDLVLLQKNVVLYPNPGVVTDLTDFVKTEIKDYL